MTLTTPLGSEYMDAQQGNLESKNTEFHQNKALAGTSKKGFLILQGDRDTTVDWRYNVRLLREKFPSANVEMIPGARHELLNEAAELRDKVIEKIIGYLEK